MGRTPLDLIRPEGVDVGALTAGADARDAAYRWLVRLRWIAIVGVAGVLAVTGPWLGLVPEGSGLGLWAVLAGLAVYNAFLTAGAARRPATSETSFLSQIVADGIALFLLLHLSGGVENPFLPLFVLHVVSANIVLGPRAATGVLLLVLGLAATLVAGEATGVLPHHCLRSARDACFGGRVDVASMAALGGLGLTLVSSSFLTRYLTERLRRSEARLADTVRGLSAQTDRLAQTRAVIEVERARLQSIIDCMADAVAFSGPDGRVVLKNAQADRVLAGANAADAEDPTSPEALRAVYQSSARAEASRPPVPFDRGGRSYEATTAVVRDLRGEPLGTVLVARDITDRLAIERHLARDERMAAVGKLAAAIAHEINNPIGVVSLYAQHALAKLPAGSPLEGHLETIRRNAESCQRITRDLLEIANPRTPERKPVDLRRLCRDVTQSVTALAAQTGVQVFDENPAGAPPLWANGDADQLRQALLNLALNAVEACGEGDRVGIRARTLEENGRAARVIEVRDTGPGVPPDKLEAIFQPFYTTKPAGTGLGLAVADNILKGHSGRLSVESGAEGGSTFRMVLPGARPDARPSEAAHRPLPQEPA